MILCRRRRCNKLAMSAAPTAASADCRPAGGTNSAQRHCAERFPAWIVMLIAVFQSWATEALSHSAPLPSLSLSYVPSFLPIVRNLRTLEAGICPYPRPFYLSHGRLYL